MRLVACLWLLLAGLGHSFAAERALPEEKPIVTFMLPDGWGFLTKPDQLLAVSPDQKVSLSVQVLWADRANSASLAYIRGVSRAGFVPTEPLETDRIEIDGMATVHGTSRGTWDNRPYTIDLFVMDAALDKVVLTAVLGEPKDTKPIEQLLFSFVTSFRRVR